MTMNESRGGRERGMDSEEDEERDGRNSRSRLELGGDLSDTEAVRRRGDYSGGIKSSHSTVGCE